MTAAEIGEIRGVNTSGVLSTLLERHLIKIVGRKNVIGRPFLYGTTREFLIRFGLKDLNDLPRIEDMAQPLGFEPPAVLMEKQRPGRDAAARRGAGAVRRGGGDRCERFDGTGAGRRAGWMPRTPRRTRSPARKAELLSRIIRGPWVCWAATAGRCGDRGWRRHAA